MSQTSAKKTNTSTKKLTKCERVVKIRTNQSKKMSQTCEKIDKQEKKDTNQ